MQNKQPVILAMDSSSPLLLLGIKKGEKIYKSQRRGIKQEQFFLPALQKLLAKADASLPDIKHIFFVRGPGRFTGIRISLTFASMMQALNGARVSSATIFEILQTQVHHSQAFIGWRQNHPQGILAVVLHAFREEYFLQLFNSENSAPMWLSKEELLNQLAKQTTPLYVAGMDKDGKSLQSLLGDKYRLAPIVDSHIRVQTLLEMAANLMYEKNALEPLYLKPARFELGQ